MSCALSVKSSIRWKLAVDAGFCWSFRFVVCGFILLLVCALFLFVVFAMAFFNCDYDICRRQRQNTSVRLLAHSRLFSMAQEIHHNSRTTRITISFRYFYIRDHSIHCQFGYCCCCCRCFGVCVCFAFRLHFPVISMEIELHAKRQIM